MTSGEPRRGVLLDSVILIDHFNGIDAATSTANRNSSLREPTNPRVRTSQANEHSSLVP